MSCIRMIVGVAVAVAPVIAAADDGATPPPAPLQLSTDTGGHKTDGYLFTAGLLVFAVPYAVSVTYAQGSYDTGHSGHLYAPLAGPWIDLANRPSCAAIENTCDHSTRTDTILVVDGLLQAAGVVMMLDAVFLDHSHRAVADDMKVHLLPTTYAGTGAGLNVFARF